MIYDEKHFWAEILQEKVFYDTKNTHHSIIKWQIHSLFCSKSKKLTVL